MKQSDTFRTPPTILFKELDSVFNFFWDACCEYKKQVSFSAHDTNCLVAEQIPFIGPTYDYLKTDMQDMHHLMQREWDGMHGDTIFINPPYSNVMPFMKKAWEDAKHFRVVMLLKADMSTRWFNNCLDELTEGKYPYQPCQIRQGDLTIKQSVEILLELMQSLEFSKHDDYTASRYLGNKVGILHLRNRIKFYVSEEVFQREAAMEYCNMANIANDEYLQTVKETKNYKRVADGIVSKAGANFPSMLMILDRR